MKFFLSMILAALVGIPASAQSADKILKQAEKALGGSKVLRSIRSIDKVGVVTRSADGESGRYELRASRPNLFATAMDIAGFESETGYNGRSAWKRDSRDGLQTLTGESAIAVQSLADLRNNMWLNAKTDRSRIVAGGHSKLEGKDTNVVVLTTSKGRSTRIYFDATSGLPLRDEIQGIDGPEIWDYADYRPVSGTMQPFAYSVSIGEKRYTLKLDKVEINTDIPRSAFDFPVMSDKPLPDLTKLLADLRANEDRIDDILDTYAFTQKQIRREIARDGTLRETGSETYQLSFYKGYRIRRLVEKNSKPLSSSDQAEADRDAGKRVAEIDKMIARDDPKTGTQSANGTPSERGGRISIAEVLRASNLINPRRERFRGRDVIVFDFEPNPSFDFKNAKSMIKFFGKTAGVMWIDESDKQVARIEATLSDNISVGGGVLAKLRKGASFTLDQERVNNEIWLPSQTDINLSVRVLLVKGIELNQVVKSYDYRKFDTVVKDAKMDEVRKP